MTAANVLSVVMIEGRSTPVPEAGCWLWTGSPGAGGYGVLVTGRKTMKAHRASWIVHRGPIPDGCKVCHRCDTPACVNPDHLFLGSQRDNVHDMVRKGRCQKNMLGRYGNLSPLAKLSEQEAREIRRLHADGRSQHSLAKQFGRSPMTINRLVRNISWRNL